MKRVRRNDRGSALIIALAFLLLFSLWLSATLAAAQSGLHITQTLRVQPKQLYAADSAIEQTIQKVRYDANAGTWNDSDCNNPKVADESAGGLKFESPQQTVYVKCEPDGTSGRADEGESSPPVGLIALSNGANGEYAYQQLGNSIVRVDGGAYSNTPMLFQNGNPCDANGNNCQQLNLCPRNQKTITDGVLVKNTATVTSISSPFTPGDVGVPIVGNGIPTGTTIASYVAAGSITMSKAATSSGINRVIGFRENYPRLQSQCHIPTAAEDPTGEARRKGKITAVPVPTPTTVSCDQTLIVALQFNCVNKMNPPSTYTPDPIGNDPNYPVDKSTGYAHQTPPLCSSAPHVVQLLPGRYDDAAALSALTTTCDKLIWFTPGSYYFDFPDSSPVWTIGASNLPNLTVVGGAKTWDREPFTAAISYNNSTKLTTVTATSAVFKATDANAAYINAGYNLPYKTLIKSVSGDKTSATFSGQPLVNNVPNETFTVSPITSTVNPLGSLCDPTTGTDHLGVEFVFGGQSRMLVTDGKTELCSPVLGTHQQLTMYGVKAALGQLRAQSGCIVQQPYSSNGSGCAMVLAPQGSKPAFMVHGTIYAPNAAIDLSLQGVGYQIVSRGIVARVISLGVSPSAQFTDPLIYSPNFGSVPGAPRKMVLTACLDAPCDSGGKPKLRALVRIQDADENNNAGVPGYKVFIDSWSVL